MSTDKKPDDCPICGHDVPWKGLGGRNIRSGAESEYARCENCGAKLIRAVGPVAIAWQEQAA